MHIDKYILSGGIFLMLLACNGKKNRLNPENTISDSAGIVSGVRLSEKEAEHAGIRFGTFATEKHDKILVCRGNLVAAPDDKSVLVAPADGRVVSLNCHPGEYLYAGSVIACIESSEVINLQQEFLETKNQLEYLHEEYTRQGELAVENATSIKKMQVAKRDYHSVELKMKALQLQLEILGINADSLNQTSMSPVIHLLMPESGTVERILISRGMYANKGVKLIEIHKTSTVAARLKVAESYAKLLKSGQPAEVFTASDSLTPIHLKISSVSREVNPVEQCAFVYVNMPGKDHIPGMSVAAKITLGPDSMKLLPSNSLLADDSRYYLFVKKSGIIRKILVEKGSTFEGLCEIRNVGFEQSDSIVLEGVEYLKNYFKPF